MRPKKKIPEIDWEKHFYHLPSRIVECVSESIFLISKKKKKQEKKTRKKKKQTKETKEEKRISVENLTGYYDAFCKFAQRTFNLLDRVVNFSSLFM